MYTIGQVSEMFSLPISTLKMCIRDSRNPELARLHEHISLNYSEDYAQILLEENPKRIIENKPMLRA